MLQFCLQAPLNRVFNIKTDLFTDSASVMPFNELTGSIPDFSKTNLSYLYVLPPLHPFYDTRPIPLPWFTDFRIFGSTRRELSANSLVGTLPIYLFSMPSISEMYVYSGAVYSLILPRESNTSLFLVATVALVETTSTGPFLTKIGAKPCLYCTHTLQ